MSINPQKKGLSRRRFLGGSLAAIAGTGLAGSARLFGSLTPAEKVPLKIKEYRTLGRTGVKVSDISFGSGELKEPALLEAMLDAGINYIDTADCYGDSEEKIGKALRSRRKEFYLSTKIDERDDRGVQKKLERCLNRLKTDYIDLVFFHDVRATEYDRIFNSGGLEVLEKAIDELATIIGHDVAMPILEEEIARQQAARREAEAERVELLAKMEALMKEDLE